MSNRFPVTIPEPTPDLNRLTECVRQIKILLETMTGDRDKDSLGVSRLYNQRTPPIRGGRGDLWVNSDTKQLAFFNGRTWEAIL